MPGVSFSEKFLVIQVTCIVMSIHLFIIMQLLSAIV